VGEVRSQNDFDFRFPRRRRFLHAASVCRGKALSLSSMVEFVLLPSSYCILCDKVSDFVRRVCGSSIRRGVAAG
jgi:hypothetical protein